MVQIDCNQLRMGRSHYIIIVTIVFWLASTRRISLWLPLGRLFPKVSHDNWLEIIIMDSVLTIWILDPPGRYWCHHQDTTDVTTRSKQLKVGEPREIRSLLHPFFLAKSWTSGIGDFWSLCPSSSWLTHLFDYSFSFCFLLKGRLKVKEAAQHICPSVTPLGVR